MAGQTILMGIVKKLRVYADSWNFKHIVHFEKIGGYEGVNTLKGYRSPKIYSPKEVVEQ